jgi:hypothetical protein
MRRDVDSRCWLSLFGPKNVQSRSTEKPRFRLLSSGSLMVTFRLSGSAGAAAGDPASGGGGAPAAGPGLEEEEAAAAAGAAAAPTDNRY